MLRDRLVVCGVNHEGIQRRLLTEKNLTFETALDLATSIEAAEKNVKTLSASQVSATPPSSAAEVNYAKDSKMLKCYRCGGKHKANVCKFKEAECHFCKKKGHIASVCRAKQGGAKQGGAKSKAEPKKKAQVHTVEPEAESDNEYSLCTIQSKSRSPIRVLVTIDEVPVEMVYDTGAAYSLLNRSTYHKIERHSRKSLQPSEVTLTTYTGEEIAILGSFQAEVQCGENKEVLMLHVVDGEGPNLMGRDSMGKFKVNLHNIVGEGVNSDLQKLLDKHSEVFSDKLGKLKGHKVKLHVNPQAMPKFFRQDLCHFPSSH